MRENTPRRRKERARQSEFDRKYNVDTTTQVSATALQIPDGRGEAALHAVGYQPTSIAAIHKIIGTVPVPHREFIFIDIGAGKGRALLIASHYPFRKIIGVEISPNLCEIARRNIAVYRDPAQKCHEIECVCADGARYDLPGDGNLVLYLYNPFGEPVMRAFIERVRHAARTAHREIWIVYANAVFATLLDEAEFLSRIENAAGLVIYRTKSASDG